MTGGRDEHGPALFIIPVDTGVPVRLVEGSVGQSRVVAARRFDCLCRSVHHRAGRVARRATRWHAGSICRTCWFAREAIASCPTGAGWSTCRELFARFLAARPGDDDIHPLTRLGNQGALRTFDVARDGRSIVFDRSRQNSNIVLIDLPK